MAIKWGNTAVTVVKWGNTTCTKVYWGSTVVFPTGGYDGSSYSYPLQNRFTTFQAWSINQNIKKTTLSSVCIKSTDSINGSLFSSVSITWTCNDTSPTFNHDIKISGGIAGAGGKNGTRHNMPSGTSTYTDTLDLSDVTVTGILTVSFDVYNSVNSYVICTITPTKVIFNA